MQLAIHERRWFRFSVIQPCLLARVALWIGAHDRSLDALCVALILLALAWG